MNVSLGGGIPEDSGEVTQLSPLLSFKTVKSLELLGGILVFFREGLFSP